MRIESLKRQFERETQNLLFKYAPKFMKKGYLITWSQQYIPIKNKAFYNKVKERPAIKLEKKK